MTRDVTIVIAPRERFSHTQASLDSLYANTPDRFSLVYVDGGSPRYVRRYLERASKERGFRLIRTSHYLCPNAARNIGMGHITGKYVAFLDNDILVAPGWLEGLIRCADETGAWAVGPLYFERGFETVHMAGGDLTSERRGDGMVFQERHRYPHQRIAELTAPIQRSRVDVIEFHAFLVPTAVLGSIGPFDEGMLSTREGIDWCLTVASRGGTLYVEPRAAISYMEPDSLRWSDIPYWSTRWSERWCVASLEHFAKKWGGTIEAGQLDWVRNHRRILLGPRWRRLHRILGRYGDGFGERVVFPTERLLNGLLFRIPSRRTA